MTKSSVGSGRKHGYPPGSNAAPEEQRLYAAMHGGTAWEDPRPGDVAELIDWYYTLPGCGNGGSLHIVTEDHNCDDHHLEWCAGYADGIGDKCGSDLANLLSRMNAYDRVHCIDMIKGA